MCTGNIPTAFQAWNFSPEVPRTKLEQKSKDSAFTLNALHNKCVGVIYPLLVDAIPFSNTNQPFFSITLAQHSSIDMICKGGTVTLKHSYPHFFAQFPLPSIPH